MWKNRWVVLFLASFSVISAANGQPGSSRLQRPKLVVGIVVDQMRWDYLYRFYNRFGETGFRRLLTTGFSCENTLINYLPSYTAVGHTCVFTGSVPAITGISGNDWTEQLTGRMVYCTDDSTVSSVGVPASEDGKMSPRNLKVSTITDELRIATHFQSRTVGVSLKDRASILPAGHAATGAYWLDDASGRFITSTYYMEKLPAWAESFNSAGHIEKLVSGGWNTLLPIGTYIQSDSDNRTYEGKLPGEASPVFPHDTKAAYAKYHGAFRSTAFGNTLTLEFARAALDGYALGNGPATDFLTINCASTDYVGHLFGPNSIEVEDTYLRLDKDLGDFFSYLDKTLGKDNYLVFLTADHGASNAVGFNQEHHIPAELFSAASVVASLDSALEKKFGIAKLVRSAANYQLNFDLKKIDSAKADFAAIKTAAVDFMQRVPGVNFAVDMDRIQDAAIPEPIKTMITNGYNFKRSGQVEIIFEPGWLESYARTGTTHGGWNPYDTHIPLLFMGWHIPAGKLNRTVHMTDISPTIAALLHIQMPNGCVGTPIPEVTGTTNR